MKSFALTAAGLCLATTALAQPSGLENWNPGSLYPNGISARQILDAPVKAENGKRIGEVKDVIVDANGVLSTLVVKVGGFPALGNRHIGVPWKDVAIAQDMEFIQVALRAVESGTYSLSGEAPRGEGMRAALNAWRVNELIGDYARLADVPRYGLVTDVIFSNGAIAKAIVVERAPAWGGAGAYAFPFAGFERGARDYALPYRRDELTALQPFDYAKLGRQSIYASAGR